MASTIFVARAAASGLPEEPSRRRLATMPERIAGAAIDALLLAVATGVLGSRLAADVAATTQVRITSAGERVVLPAVESDWLLPALPIALTAVYVIVFLALWGRTPGGWAVGIRCIRADTGGRPGWSVSIRRWLLLFGVAAALSFVPVIGPWAWLVTVVVGLSPLWDRSGLLRGYHDAFAGDLVVRDRELLGRG